MLTPKEVAERTFHTCRFNGYRTEDVDDFMDILTEDYGSLYQENAVLKSKIKVLVEKIGEYRATEDDMRLNLLNARRSAETILTNAEQERQTILAEAEEKRTAMVAEAEEKSAAMVAEAEEKSAAMVAEAEEKSTAMVAEAEEKYRAVMENVDSSAAVLRERLLKETAEEEARLSAARQSTKTFIKGMRALVQAQSAFLDRLPSPEELDPEHEGVSAQEAPAEEPAPAAEVPAEEAGQVIDLGNTAQ